MEDEGCDQYATKGRDLVPRDGPKDLAEFAATFGGDAFRHEIMSKLSASTFIDCEGHEWSSLLHDHHLFKAHLESSYNRPFHLLLSVYETDTTKLYYFAAQVHRQETLQLNFLAELDLNQYQGLPFRYQTQSVNGVVCCSVNSVTNIVASRDAPVALLCPGSRKHLIVQPDPSFREANNEASYQLCYTQDNEYQLQLLRLQWNFNDEGADHPTNFIVFSQIVGTHHWSKVLELDLKDPQKSRKEMEEEYGIKPPLDLIRNRAALQTKRTVCLEGAIHWIIKDGGINTIVAFNLRTSKFEVATIPLPMTYVDVGDAFNGLFYANGCIAIIGGPISGNPKQGTLRGCLWTYNKLETSWDSKFIRVSSDPSSTIASTGDNVLTLLSKNRLCLA